MSRLEPHQLIPDLRLVLCDQNAAVVDAWREQFDENPEVEIFHGDILEVEADVLVLPGNAFGFLDRGLELAVSEKFGWDVEVALRQAAVERFHGEMLVGQAHIVPLGPPFRHLLYTCIARTPRPLDGSLNAFLAARGAFAALVDARRSDEGDDSPRVVMPGLGTGESGLLPLVSARQLRYAYEIFTGRRGLGDKSLSRLGEREKKLQTLPKSASEE